VNDGPSRALHVGIMASHSIANSDRIVNSEAMAKLAAIGFFVYGAVYILIGTLAAKVALGSGGRLTGSKGAVLEVARAPFGGILLIFVMIGLFAYSTWRIVQAFVDPERKGATAHGIFIRIGRLVSAISYGALAVFTFQLVIGAGASGGDSNWALRLITEPLGAVLGTIVGLFIVGVGIEQFRKAYTADFGERLREHHMSGPERAGGHIAARLGFSARGVVFVMTGAYLLYAVFDANPNRAKSIEELLLTLLRLPYGNWIMLIVALGLAGYGLFMILVSFHRRHPY
jgi:hypothetical protein